MKVERSLTRRQTAIKHFREVLKKYKRNPEYVDIDVFLFTEQEVIFIYEFLIKSKKKQK